MMAKIHLNFYLQPSKFKLAQHLKFNQRCILKHPEYALLIELKNYIPRHMGQTPHWAKRHIGQIKSTEDYIQRPIGQMRHIGQITLF